MLSYAIERVLLYQDFFVNHITEVMPNIISVYFDGVLKQKRKKERLELFLSLL